MKLTRRGLFGLAAGAGAAAALPGVKAAAAIQSSSKQVLSAIDAELGEITAGRIYTSGGMVDFENGVFTIYADKFDIAKPGQFGSEGQ